MARQTLPDRQDELNLAHAEEQVFLHLNRQPRELDRIDALTDPEIRHHVQTILDLTPTKRH